MLVPSHFEERLIWAVEHGEPADFSADRGKESCAVLRSEVIRSVMLGLPNLALPVQTIVCRTRLAIRGAIIEGGLDLAGGRAASGGPMPAIELRECVLQDQVCLDDAHLVALTLEGCIVAPSEGGQEAIISMRNARIEGGLRVAHLQPTSEDALLRLDAQGVSVEGDVWISHALLRARPRDLPYALDLSNSVVGGQLSIHPDDVFYGGVALANAHVRGDVRILNALITDGEDDASRQEKLEFRNALHAQGANLEGSLAIWNDPQVSRQACEVIGTVSLQDLAVGGALEIVAVSVAKGDAVLDGVTVHGNVALGSDGKPFDVDGDLTMVSGHADRGLEINGRIAGDLSLRGCAVAGAADLNVELGYLANADPDNNWNFDNWDVDLIGSEFAGNLSIRAACTSVNALRIHVGGICEIASRLSGDLILCDAVFDSDLRLLDVAVDRSGSVQLAGAKVEGCLGVGSLNDFDIQWPTRADLICYPGYTLLAARLFAGGLDGWPEDLLGLDVEFLVKDGEEARLVDAHVLDELNAAGALSLSSNEAVTDYVKLHCASRGGSVPCAVVESEEEVFVLPGGVALRPVLVEQSGSNFSVEADQSIGADFVRTRFTVDANGYVWQVSEEKLGELDAQLAPYRYWWSRRRWGNLRLREKLDLRGGRAVKRIKIDEFKRLVPRWKQEFKLVVDLQEASCGTLQDREGVAWGEGTELRLENFTYRQIAAPGEPTLLPPPSSPQVPKKKIQRKAWLEGALHFTLPNGRLPSEVKQRLAWLESRSQRLSFHPQPYSQLAKVLRSQGDYDGARHVEAAKLDAEARRPPQDDWLSRFLHPIDRALNWLFYFFFYYGFSPWRAFATMVFCVSLGSLGVVVADRNDMLVIDTTPVASVAVEHGDQLVAATPLQSSNVREGLPCRMAISPYLYAADVFIPLLDLRQRIRCDVIYPDPVHFPTPWDTFWTAGQPPLRRTWNAVLAFGKWPSLWRFLRSLYAALGWIVTSLAVLTFSGVLRRWVESKD